MILTVIHLPRSNNDVEDGDLVINYQGHAFIYDENAHKEMSQFLKKASRFLVYYEHNELKTRCIIPAGKFKWLKPGMEVKETDIVVEWKLGQYRWQELVEIKCPCCGLTTQ